MATPSRPNLATAVRLVDTGRLDRAETICRRLLAQTPGNPAVMQVLGTIAQRHGRLDDAVTWYERALAARPGTGPIMCRLGAIHTLQGRYEDALEKYDAVLGREPDSIAALAGKATVLERQGRDDEAVALLRPLIDRGDRDPGALATYARLLGRAGRAAEAASLLAATVAEIPAAKSSVELWYALGRARDALGEHDDAFEAFRHANELSALPYSVDEDVVRFDRWRAAYPSARIPALPASGHPSDRVVFIVGMPRSGTTLVEQILAAHPAVHGAGENEIVHRLAFGLSRRLGRPGPLAPLAAGLEPSMLATLAAELDDTFRALAPEATRVTDKSLGNFLVLGLLARLLPRSRVIFCRRDPMATCFSCYVNALPGGAHRYATDLRQLGLYYRAHTQLMTHWREVLDIPWHDVVYEDLIADPGATIRSLVEFCGIDWDDACLRFHATGRAVATTSYDQVRRPIYASSVARYAPYEKHLVALRRALDDLGRHGMTRDVRSP